MRRLILISFIKLKIRTIPSLIIFLDGVAQEKILGFEGLSDGLPEGKEDEWPTIKLARLLGQKGAIDKSKIVDEEEKEREIQMKMDNLRNAFISSHIDDDDELFNDDD